MLQYATNSLESVAAPAPVIVAEVMFAHEISSKQGHFFVPNRE